MFLWFIPLAATLQLPVAVATVALAALMGAFIWWNVLRPLRSRSPMLPMLRLRPWRPYAGWLSVAAVALVAFALATLTLHEQLAEWRFLPKLPGGPDLIPSHFLGHALGPVAMFIAVGVITPLVEEFGCRGKLQYRLERSLGITPAIVLTAVVFSLLHGLLVAPHHIPFALFVGWIVWRTGSIWTAVYVHALNNTAVLALLYLTHNPPTSQALPSWLWPVAIGGLLALGGLLIAVWRLNRLADSDIRGRASPPHAINSKLSTA